MAATKGINDIVAEILKNEVYKPDSGAYKIAARVLGKLPRKDLEAIELIVGCRLAVEQSR